MVQTTVDYWRTMYENFMENFRAVIGDYVPLLLGAFVVLIVGWVVALIVAGLVRSALRRTGLDRRLAARIFDENGDRAGEIERWGGRIVFYPLMLLVLVWFFQILQLNLVAQPLNSLLDRLSEFLPRLAGALLLLLLAWVIATLLRRLVARGISAARIEERFGERAGVDVQDRVPLARSFADAVYWLVLLLFLPAFFSILALEGILDPIEAMITTVLGFLPNVFAAGLILTIGWFMARIIRRIVASLLAAAGIDRLGDRLGLTTIAGEKRLSDILGLVLYVLILIPVLIASLNALGLDAITQPASTMLSTVLESIPSIFAAALVLILAYAVGRILSTLTSNLLAGIGFDTIPARLGLSQDAPRDDRTPSAIIGYLVLVGIMLFASIEAAGLLGFVSLAELVSQFVTFAGQVILGLIIFGIGLYLAGLAARTILSSASPQSGVLARAAQIAIVLLAAAVGLRQMGLANEIINLAFGLLLGAVAVAAALAFGLGGRDIAQQQLKVWVDAIRGRGARGR